MKRPCIQTRVVEIRFDKYQKATSADIPNQFEVLGVVESQLTDSPPKVWLRVLADWSCDVWDVQFSLCKDGSDLPRSYPRTHTYIGTVEDSWNIYQVEDDPDHR